MSRYSGRVVGVLASGEWGSEQVDKGLHRAVNRLALVAAGIFFAAVGAALPTAGAETVLWVTGTGKTPYSPESLLAGEYSADRLIAVDYPASFGPLSGPADPSFGQSVAIGASNLESLARSTTGPLVIVGFSQGALVAQQAAMELNDDPGVGSDTTFILIANPNLGAFSNAYGGSIPFLDYAPRPLTETRFTTIAVINEYDAWADPISQPDNTLAVLNSIMGMAYLHPVAHNTDLSAVPTQNISVTVNSQGGTLATYLVPAKQLPLTLPLRQAGVPDEIVDDIDANLRPVIDAAYARNRTPQSSAAVVKSSQAAKPDASDKQSTGSREKATQSRRVSAKSAPDSGVSLAARRDSSSRPAATDTSARRSPER